SIVAFDHFGHGKTKGKRGYCPSFDAVLDSVSMVIKKAENIFPNKPIFLYGHSMGGNVVVNYVLRKNSNLQGVIASSPFLALAFEPPKWKIKMAQFLRKIFPKMTLNNGLNISKISRIPEEVRKYKKDKLMHGKVGFVYSLDFIETGKWAVENAEKLKLPMILLHGTSDELTNFRASQEFAKKTNFATFKKYEGGYHELHNDLCREKFMSDILKWLRAQI
ncbi:lysophospholipase, partial [Candidatus Gracilibacteria bacterium]|nr:lysophospholipase [Candidatus Gracilibacteria bacterium]